MSSVVSLSIDAPLFARFPALRVGGLLVAHLDRVAPILTRSELDARWRTAVAELGRGGITIENVASVPAIQQWREAFAACGLPDSVYRGSVEALVRRVLKAGRVMTAVPVAALSDAISATHLAPLNGYDVDALPARTIRLRMLRPDTDWFLPLGARPTDLPRNPRVVVYAAGETVLSWSFNYRSSRQICLHPETSLAVFFSEGVRSQHADTIAAALEDLGSVLARGGADVSPAAFVDRSTPEVELSFTTNCGSP
jgi:DNA/RNA-binding domain of Phe-tRNA-synthetase-like protein